METLDAPSFAATDEAASPLNLCTDHSSFRMGWYPTEPEACAAFDDRVAASNAFRIYREVRGEYIQPLIGTEEKTSRIDRILVPLGPAIQAGWKEGAIGVEIKSSEKTKTKFGPVIAQAIDYQRCAFRLTEGVPGLLVMPTWIFIFPLESVAGPLASVLIQNRVGTCSFTGADTLRFNAPNQCLNIFRDGKVSAMPIVAGKKRGSR